MEGVPSPAGVLANALRRFSGDGTEARLRQAAWVARCVGRGENAPLRRADIAALADVLEARTISRDTVMFRRGDRNSGVWIVREGRVELSVGARRRRAVVHVLHPGDVDGDVQLLLHMAMPYSARALTEVTYLHVGAAEFDPLIQRNPMLARRWMSSIAARLATSQTRILGLLGRSLTEQVARLLLDEAERGRVTLTQQTLAAMLGVHRPSLNRILTEMEDDDIIEISYGVIVIADYDRLVDLAG